MTQDVYMSREHVHTEVAAVLDRAAGIPTNKRRGTLRTEAEIASDVARAGIEPATFRFSDGSDCGTSSFVLVRQD